MKRQEFDRSKDQASAQLWKKEPLEIYFPSFDSFSVKKWNHSFYTLLACGFLMCTNNLAYSNWNSFTTRWISYWFLLYFCALYHNQSLNPMQSNSACACLPVVGSSANITDGLASSSHAKDRRFFSPPLIPRTFASPTLVSAQLTLSTQMPKGVR